MEHEKLFYLTPELGEIIGKGGQAKVYQIDINGERYAYKVPTEKRYFIEKECEILQYLSALFPEQYGGAVKIVSLGGCYKGLMMPHFGKTLSQYYKELNDPISLLRLGIRIIGCLE